MQRATARWTISRADTIERFDIQFRDAAGSLQIGPRIKMENGLWRIATIQVAQWAEVHIARLGPERWGAEDELFTIHREAWRPEFRIEFAPEESRGFHALDFAWPGDVWLNAQRVGLVQADEHRLTLSSQFEPDTGVLIAAVVLFILREIIEHEFV